RRQVRERLEIPSPYFVSLGFSPAVLDALDVGHSQKLKCSVVPLYDDAGKYCVGHIARQEMAVCEKCGKCHRENENCASGKYKWRFPKGFDKSSYLYGYSNLPPSITSPVVLVEGVKEVWKLREADIPAVACLGSDLTKGQANKLLQTRK